MFKIYFSFNIQHIRVYSNSNLKGFQRPSRGTFEVDTSRYLCLSLCLDGLEMENVPQMVTITFNGAINNNNIPIYQEIFKEERLNPNGCTVSAQKKTEQFYNFDSYPFF